MSLVSLTKHGLYLPSVHLYLDARSAPGTVFVSHAHADHCTKAARILCTPETGALHEARRGCRAALTVGWEETIHLSDAAVTLQSAGHILGSAMLIAQSDDGIVAYTGDFKRRPNPFTPPVTIPRCDTLVMECTFGEARYVFPPDEELLEQAFAFVDETFTDGGVPVFLAYTLGKAQEILYHLTAQGYQVMVHGAIARLCDIHITLGYTFPGPGTWTRYRRGETRGYVLLTPPGTRKTSMVQSIPGRRVCYLTGWANHPGAFNIYKDCDLVLPFSDHADWNELLQTAVDSGASKIYTVHGHEGFAAHLRTLGIDAEHLADHPSFDTLDDDAPEIAAALGRQTNDPKPQDSQLDFDL